MSIHPSESSSVDSYLGNQRYGEIFVKALLSAEGFKFPCFHARCDIPIDCFPGADDLSEWSIFSFQLLHILFGMVHVGCRKKGVPDAREALESPKPIVATAGGIGFVGTYENWNRLRGSSVPLRSLGSIRWDPLMAMRCSLPCD